MGGRGGSGTPEARQPALVKVPSVNADELADRDVRDAYEDVLNITNSQVAWVDLTRLRTALNTRGMSRDRQDEALLRMVDQRKIRLIPEENQKVISDRDRAAAIRLSGEDKHLIAFRDRL